MEQLRDGHALFPAGLQVPHDHLAGRPFVGPDDDRPLCSPRRGELLRERGNHAESPGKLDAFLVAVGGEDVAPVLTLAAGLRDRGIAVEYALRNQPIRKQLELAAARGAPRAVIIGPDERKAKVAVVRDLKTGKQRKVALTKVRKGVFR